jgi:hypothetical protein
LKSWNEIKTITNSEKNKSPFEIRRETLWFNKNIKLNGKEMYWNSLHEKGINIIHDIVKENGHFLSKAELDQKYNTTCDLLKFNVLKNAIPNEWRIKLKTMHVPAAAISFLEPIYIKVNGTLKPIQLIKNKDFYWTLVKHCKKEPIVLDNLLRETGVDNKNKGQIFIINKAVRDTRIKTFQYKILYNLVPCNHYLKRINKSDTHFCNYCNNNSIDDLNHYLYECDLIKPFWNSFQNWWRNVTNEHITLSATKIKVGILGNYTKNETLNACIIMAKWHIYKNKLNESHIFFYRFLCDLKYYLIIEKNIYLKQGKLHIYTAKWQTIEDYIT